MSSPAGGPTVTHLPAEPGGGTVTHVAASPATTVGLPVRGSGFDEELRQLLRSRLYLVHLLASAFYILLLALSLIIPGQDEEPALRPDQGYWWRLAVPLAVSLLGAVVLWRSPGMSLRSLRLWELIFFATHAAYNGHLRFDMLAHAADGSQLAPSLTVGFRGLASLQGFVTLILAYGILIPNSPRRSLVGVVALTAVPFLVIPVATAVNPGLRWGHFFALLIQAACILVFPAAIAVFVATRTTALQRRAFEAERRANELGQYVLKRKLGAGGMGEVFLAEHRLLKRPCAIKFVRAELASHPSTVARFEREVQAVTGLTHFNTVRVYDYGRADDGAFYYVMEYLDGPTLESLVRDAGPLDPARVVYLLRQVCGALAEAHSHGMVHRDIKPGNLLVAALGGQHDVVKVLDFGLVQDLTTAAGDDRLTMAGVVIGTPAYMAPEQASGEGGLDARCDVYSLGAVAFFALAGRPPFECRTAGQYLTAHMTQAPPRLTDLRPEVPADLAAVVARCLAKNPADRFPNVDELDRALAACECAGSWTAGTAAAWWAATPTRPQPAEGNTTRAHPVGQESPA